LTFHQAAPARSQLLSYTEAQWCAQECLETANVLLYEYIPAGRYMAIPGMTKITPFVAIRQIRVQ
jgi:hypothetical protein